MPAAIRLWFLSGILLCVSPSRAASFDLQECKKLFLSGKYNEVVEITSEALESRERGEELRLLHADSLWTAGRYPEAKQAIDTARRAYYYSIRVRLLAHKIYKSAGELEKAQEVLDEVNMMGGSRRFGYREPIDVVALGQAAVLLGADPRLVLDNFLQPAKKAEPNMREVYLAIGQLALDKHDYALAGKSFQEGLQKFAKDPDLLCGLAEALASSDRGAMLGTLEKVFQANPNHLEGRLLLVDHLVDAEEYDDALDELQKIEEVNPNRPEMWAYRGVIAHLQNKSEDEQNAREKALKYWKSNPEVDHILGRKLAQKYRFAEGAKYQRQALGFDPKYLPAQIQLAQDLLRLGVEDEGWTLAEMVFRADAYDVAAYNLVTLQDTLKTFTTLTNEHFVVKMAPNEAPVYGRQVLALLEKAREQLTRKYGLELKEPVTIEIFPQQKDFAVRTFGMPGGEGYLGVCFGNVITANSPATHTMNWQSVLWHEFCHVITLNLTKNRMPRWFSEGISVYEERRADPRWGEQMNPKYREMILEGGMKPIADLSSAFMTPKSGLHLQFAYYQSSLVIEFIIERFGLEPLRSILRDLGGGKPINEALAAHTDSLDTLEKDFEQFARGAAEALGPETRWAKPKRNSRGDIDLSWAALHPENVIALMERASDLMESDKYDEALPLLEKVIQLYPAQNGGDSAYEMLAHIYRKKQEPEKERKVLADWIKLDPEAKDALARLIELEMPLKDHASMRKHAEMLLEINPMLPQAHRALGLAEEETGSDTNAIAAFETVLRLDPPDPADIHFRLARLFQKQQKPEARRHILLCLQDAPRFRKGHELLREILGETSEPKPNEIAK